MIIVGGSYSGLAAAMALGRALRSVLVIDSGKPCNRQTPQSHNFLTQDGKTPGEIADLARRQVAKYSGVRFLKESADTATKTKEGFEISTSSGELFSAAKLILAAGIKDLLPDIRGLRECWGISVLHCPYCHGYEVKNEPTGILGNGEYGFEFSKFILNWTTDLSLFTNGRSALTKEQRELLEKHQVRIIEKEISELEHTNGYLRNLVFTDGSRSAINALYTKTAFEQNSRIAEDLGCKLTEEGYIETDQFQKTSVSGIYACGDSTTALRTLSVAVSTGATAGIILNKEFVLERF